MGSLAEATSMQTIGSYASDQWLQKGMEKKERKKEILSPTNSHVFFVGFFFFALCSQGLDAEVAMLPAICCPSLCTEEDQTNLWCQQKCLLSDAAILKAVEASPPMRMLVITIHWKAEHHHHLWRGLGITSRGEDGHQHPWGSLAMARLGTNTCEK